MKKLKTIIVDIVMFLIILISIAILISSRWALSTFDNLNLDEIFFQIMVPMQGANTNYFKEYFIHAFIPLLIITIIIFLLFVKKYDNKLNLKLNIKKFNKDINIGIFNHKSIYLIILLLFSVYHGSKVLGLKEFIQNQLTTSTFIEENYVDPNSVEIKFPKKKRNLIYIYLESMESSFASYDDGGLEYDSLIPKLTSLAKKNINFSNTEQLGGFYSTPGATWTVGAMVAQSSGLPLKLSINGNSYSGYNKFLPGATILGDILKKEGYNQEIMFGSDAKFAGRNELYKEHGNYKIYDYYTAIKKEKITEEDKVWWGFEDKNLFEYAKEELDTLSSKKEPFNLTLLTVDTHAEDGWLSDDCEEKFDSHYANAVYCSDKTVSSFIKWLKTQDYYKDTTIILAGDHLTMAKYYIGDEYSYSERTGFDLFINSSIEPLNKTNRQFLSFDLFPTTLSAMGVKIEGNRLGLGTNLFSEEQTLIEKLGYETTNIELSKKSLFYNKNILLNEKK